MNLFRNGVEVLSLVQLLCWNLTAAAAQSQTAVSQKTKQMTFSFPDASVGAIYLVPADYIYFASSNDKQIHAAVGKFKLSLPVNQDIVLKLNSQLRFNPDLLNKVSMQAIDGVQVSYISMDEDETVTDSIVSRLAPFKHLKYLLFGKSDVSDWGLIALGRMDNVRRLDTYMTCVTGKFLSHADNFPNLKFLSMFNCNLDSSSLRNIEKLHSLQDLDLHHDRIDATAMQGISHSKSIVHLNLSENSQVTDDTIAPLNNMHQLERLTLHETSVTIAGLRKLNRLSNLKMISLPPALSNQKPEITRLFPEAQISFRTKGKPLSQDEQKIFKPLR